MMRFPKSAAAALLLAGAALPAGAGTPVPVRVAQHTAFGRITLVLPQHVKVRQSRDGDRVELYFSRPLTVGALPSLPRNVRAMTSREGEAVLVVAPGAGLRQAWHGRRLVVDVLDPPLAATATPTTPSAVPAREQPEARPQTSGTTAGTQPGEAAPIRAGTPGAENLPVPSAPAGPTGAAPPSGASASAPVGVSAGVGSRPGATVPAAPPPPVSASPAQAQPAPAATPAIPPPADPSALAVTLPDAAPDAPPGTQGSTVLVPFDATVGAAALRRGPEALVVFDAPKALDLGALAGSRTFAAAHAETTPAATVLHFVPPVGAEVSLERARDGWRITVRRGPAALHPLKPDVADGRITIPAAESGRVVVIADPQSGAPLLLGTQRRSGEGIAMGRRAAEFALLPTWQGVAAEALTDRLELRAGPSGFVLAGAGGDLALTPTSAYADAMADSVGLTRRYDFPLLPPASLLRLLDEQIAAAAAAPPLARGRLRRAVAQSMMALGLGAEAQSVLRLAAEQDPDEAQSADNVALSGIAALLAGRTGEAEGLLDPRLEATDEIALWRGVRLASLQEGSPAAATIFAATAPMILTYPPAIRDKLLPLAAETMAAGGEAKAAAALLARRPDDPALALARGMVAEAEGNTDAALATYDAVAAGRDRLARARAAPRAVELRLAAGKLNATQAADALDRLLYVWRGDQRELALRERVAALRAQSGAWGPAVALLRETATEFPDQEAEIQGRMRKLFADFLRSQGVKTMQPIELLALVDENAELLPTGPAEAALQAELADRLMALDLPRQAGRIIAKLAESAPAGAGRAGLGARLAELRLREDDAAGALAALSKSAADGIPADLVERRTLLFADASARHGERDTAVSALAKLATPAADAARAGLFELAQDWARATQAMGDCIAKSVPDSGELDAVARSKLVRLATDAERAGDDQALASLRARFEPRLGNGDGADMFRLLTSRPIAGVADLPRAAKEASLARSVAQAQMPASPVAGAAR